MAEAFNMVYRLFAPLLVVVVIIAGVDLSSGLIKNTQEKQTAISIAYASCIGGAIPASNCMPAGPPSKGGKDGTSCVAAGVGISVPGMCIGGCCKGFNNKQAGDAVGGGGKEALKAMMDVVKEFLKPKPKTPGTPDNRPELPVCQSLVVSPTLPLEPGESATLTWTLGGGKPETVVISPGVGAVVGFSTRVSPRSSTTYTVTVTNERGSVTCPKVRVYVGPRDGDDDGTFTDDNASARSGDVDIWSSGGDNGAAQNATNSAYDDIWNGGTQQDGTGQGGTNDGDDYYDFLSSLAEDDTVPAEPQQPADYSEYYYGDDSDFDWSDFNGEEPSWDNVDLQEGYIGETDINGLALGAREDNYDFYDEYDDGFSQNSNGLTNEEIYGVWNRPQSPATGGLGLSGGFGGGFGSGASNVPVDLSAPSESTSIFGRIGKWFKDTFCFWCQNAAYINGGQGQFAAVTNSFAPTKNKVVLPTRNSRETNKSPRGTSAPTLSNSFVFTWDRILRQRIPVAIFDSVLKYEYAVGRPGELVRIMVRYKKPEKKDVSKYTPATLFTLEKMKKKPYNLLLTAERNLVKTGVGEERDRLIVECNAKALTLVGALPTFVSQAKASDAKRITDNNDALKAGKIIKLKDGDIKGPIQELFGFYLACGNPQGDKSKIASQINNNITPCASGYVRSQESNTCIPEKKQEQCTKDFKSGVEVCKGKAKTSGSPGTTEKEEKVECKTFYKTGEKRPTHCEKPKPAPKPGTKPKTEPKPKPAPSKDEVIAREKARCASRGLILKSIRPVNGQLESVCMSQPKGGASKADVEKRIADARRAEQARGQAAIDRLRDQNRRSQEAQAAKYKQAQQKAQQAAKQRQQAQRPQQRPQQRPPQKEPSWLQALLAKLRGDTQPKFPGIVAKPQCLSFTSDKLDIDGGEEITLQWAVTGATKIIITPKVTVVEIDDGAGGKKKVAKANPESDVQYTLIATNDKGEEHRCKTKKIVVDTGDDDPEGSLTCDTEIDRVKITINPDNVERPACDPEASGEQCNEDWEGERVEIGWEVEPRQCVTSCKISNQDGDIWTSSRDMQHELDGGDTDDDEFGNEGNLRESSTFTITCEDAFGNLEEDEVSAVVREE